MKLDKSVLLSIIRKQELINNTGEKAPRRKWLNTESTFQNNPGYKSSGSSPTTAGEC